MGLAAGCGRPAPGRAGVAHRLQPIPPDFRGRSRLVAKTQGSESNQ